MAAKAERILGDLWRAYAADPRQLPPHVLERARGEPEERAIADYVAGMTDRFAMDEHDRLFDPHTSRVTSLGGLLRAAQAAVDGAMRGGRRCSGSRTSGASQLRERRRLREAGAAARIWRWCAADERRAMREETA